METSQEKKIVEPETGHAFAARRTYEGKSFRVLGVGARKMHLMHVYALDFAVEDEADLAVVAGFFEDPGFMHRELHGEELARALQRDPRLFLALMEAPFGKAAELVFHHHVRMERMREEFEEGLRRTMLPGSEHRIAKLVDLIGRDLNKGDRIGLRTRENSILFVDFDGLHEIDDAPVARALWSMFLGPESVTESLKASIADTIAQIRG